MDDVTWGALTLSLTVLGAIWTWFAFRRRGVVSGLRGAAITLLPVAAYLTRTLRMFTRIADAVVDWAAALVFSPVVWLGVVLAGISVVLFVAAGVLGRHGRGRVQARQSKELPTQSEGRNRPAQPVDDEMAEIEALLRKRGIH